MSCFTDDLLTQILEKLCELVDSETPQIEGLDLQQFCENGVVTGYASIIYDEVAESTATLYFDAALQPAATAPTGAVCGQYTTKDASKCYEDAVGNEYQRLTCIPVENGIPSIGDSLTFWVLPDGSVTGAEPAGLEPCDGLVGITVNVIDGCDLSTVATTANNQVSVVGAERPIPVRIVEDCEDEITVDVEYVCNTDTNFYDSVVTTITNGVAAAPVVTATTIPCDEDKPDFEPVDECRNGTIHSVLYQIDADGTQTELSAVDTLQKCVNDCWGLAGECLCYGVGSGDASYEVDDNETDGAFSIGLTGGTGMKWEVESPAAASDGLAEFTLEVKQCIDNGSTAQLTITDADNNIYSFPASGYTQPGGNADGSGSWFFTGPGAPANGSGEIKAVTLTCSDSASGRACFERNCETGEERWYDAINGVVLTAEQIETLTDCPLPETCDEETNEAVVCAGEPGTTEGGTAIAVDDQLLQILVVDCNRAVIASSLYHVPSQEVVTEPILTEPCDPQPDTETIRECLVDTSGMQWTQISIIDPSDPGNPTVLYYDAELNLGTPEGDPDSWTPCDGIYADYVDTKLCEIDARFLLLIDSGGVFARYSFYTGKWTEVDTLSVPSAGGSADVNNFLLYNFVAPDQLTRVDVNTDTQLTNITLIDGANINPNVATNPKTFSAASFRDANGFLYAQDTGGADAGLYRINVTTGEVDFVTTISGVVGTGTSIAIDNTTDTLIVNGSNLSYQVDWITGVATAWANPPIQPNGSTFDTDGNFYVTQGNNTYVLPAGLDGNDLGNWTQIIDDFNAGANSLAYYEVTAQLPSCFFRRYGILPTGERELIGDFNVTDDSPRTVVGDVDCCCTGGGDGGSSGGIQDVNITGQPVEVELPAYTTTLGSEFFNSAFVVPSPPANTKEMVAFNNSGAWIEITTNYGTQLIPPYGTAQWCVNDDEAAITVGSVSVVGGTFNPGETWGINYRGAV